MSGPDAERVLIIGAGSLGSVYGGLLARAGHDVQLLAREPHARAIEAAGGLRLESGGEELLVPLRADWRPERIEPAEIAILLTQEPRHRRGARRAARTCGAALRLAVSLQNSVEKDDELRAWCGPGPVVGGVSMVGGTLVEPGLVRHTFDRATVVGELPTGSSARVERLAALLARRRSLGRRVGERDRRRVGEARARAADARAAGADAAAPARGAPLARARRRSTSASCARASPSRRRPAVELEDGPLDFPLRRIAAAPDDEAVELVQAEGRRFVEAGMTQIRVSMLQSVEKGQRLEVEAIHGFVVREGARLGVAVPSTELCYRLLTGMDQRLA